MEEKGLIENIKGKYGIIYLKSKFRYSGIIGGKSINFITINDERTGSLFFLNCTEIENIEVCEKVGEI
jgi:hypothetical protein